MSDDYKPGLTELRINAKSALSCIQKISLDFGVLTARVDNLEKQVSSLTEENVKLTEALQQAQVKLFENGIR